MPATSPSDEEPASERSRRFTGGGFLGVPETKDPRAALLRRVRRSESGFAFPLMNYTRGSAQILRRRALAV